MIFVCWIGCQFAFSAACTRINPPEQNIAAAHTEIAAAETNQDFKHPLVQLLQENRSACVWITAFFAAVIAAPLFEEWMFRFLLQNWLEKKMAAVLSDRNAQKIAVIGTSLFFAALHGGSRRQQTADSLYNEFIAILLANFVILIAGISFLRTFRHVSVKETFFGSGLFFRTGFFRYAAVCYGLLLSAIVLNTVLQTCRQGINTDPVPLFFVSILFGGLYCRTRNLSYSILLHACLNGTSLFLVLLHGIFRTN
ncbi:MAG: CPBP family intramembrane metalloprotease [Planctomycetaceae bacterium]|nr:CPBP family intramembrane metalloprotease [Planctomycetaceae bacterium]